MILQDRGKTHLEPPDLAPENLQSVRPSRATPKKNGNIHLLYEYHCLSKHDQWSVTYRLFQFAYPDADKPVFLTHTPHRADYPAIILNNPTSCHNNWYGPTNPLLYLSLKNKSIPHAQSVGKSLYIRRRHSIKTWSHYRVLQEIISFEKIVCERGICVLSASTSYSHCRQEIYLILIETWSVFSC